MKKAGDIISNLFRDRFGEDFMETARSSAELFTSWEGIVCEVWSRKANQTPDDIPAAAVHSRIRELERGLLLVEADHPGWIQILQTKQADLLKAVKRHCPGQDIRGMAFTLSHGSFSPPAARPVERPAGKRNAESSGEKSSGSQTGDSSQGVSQDVSQDKTGDKEFYAALKRLEESVKDKE